MRGGTLIFQPDNNQAGTLGMVLTSDGIDRWLLTCHHVLAHSNATLVATDRIFQPNAVNGVIATLTGVRFNQTLDCAAALLTVSASNEVLGIGTLAPCIPPVVGMRVIKSGWKTGISEGVIQTVSGSDVVIERLPGYPLDYLAAGRFRSGVGRSRHARTCCPPQTGIGRGATSGICHEPWCSLGITEPATSMTMRMLTVLSVVVVLGTLEAFAQQPIPPPVVQPFNDGQQWVVTAPLTYQIGDTQHMITVPAGFVTDFASIPRVFHALLAPTGRPGRGAIVHDYLYWEQSCTREQADWILMLAMMESGVDAVTRNLVYKVVDWFGTSAWEMNQQERNGGFPRVIPSEFMKIPALAVWPTYRQEMFQKGVRPTPRSATAPAYCAAAMSIEVPVP